jgi:hypothetical protein
MTTEQTETAPETKATKKATRGARRANVAPVKAKARIKRHEAHETTHAREARRPLSSTCSNGPTELPLRSCSKLLAGNHIRCAASSREPLARKWASR